MNPAATAPAPRRASPRPAIEAHRVHFTGSGREYFRVWLVNVLLTIVTLGLYTPWARRRKAQYFYSHTRVAGSPLEFVAEQRRMVIGFLLFMALYLAYELARQTGQTTATGLLMFGFAALAPYLWASAMRFRLGATRWRGIRLAFTAGWKEVYLASWPVFVIPAVWMLILFVGAGLAPDLPAGAAAPAGAPLALLSPDRRALALAGLGLGAVLTLLCIIRLEYNYRRLLVARTRIGGQPGRWKPVYGDFVKVWLATVGFFLLCTLAALAALAALTGGALLALRHSLDSAGGMIMAALLLIFVTLLFFMLTSLPARAYREARMFQLVWNNIGFSQIARARTDLRTGRFVALRLKNLLLTLLTLGFYRPFAVASEYAAKVGSVTLHIKGGTEQLAGELVRQQGAFGDAAADALGLDLIG